MPPTMPLPVPPVWFLAGPPFSGKSTVAALLAEIRGCPCFDLDDLVVRETGMSVPDLFRLHGEARFREWESLCLQRLLASPEPGVVALGGGTLLDPRNLRAIQEKGLLFTLQVRESDLLARCSSDRPLAHDPKSLRTLLRRRRLHYLSLPGGIDARGLEPREIARRIMEQAMSPRLP